MKKTKFSRFIQFFLIVSLIFTQLTFLDNTRVAAAGYTSVTLSETQGEPGDRVTVYVTNLPYYYDYGYIYFDSNNNGIRDYSENSSYVYSSNSYSLTGTLTIPSVTSGNYSIRYDSSYYYNADGSTTYTVDVEPSLSLSTSKGQVGSTATVSLSNLPAYDSGYIYFDENSNGTRDTGEGTFVYANYSGSASSTITIPDVSEGTYNIKYQSSTNTEVIVTTSFTVVGSPKVTLSSTKGKSGSSTTVSVSNLPYSYDYGYIYFDTNNNGTRDYGEAQSYVSSYYSYGLSGTLYIPSVTAGDYSIRYQSSYYTYAKGSASFTVEPSISMSTTKGAVGGSTTVSLSNLPAYDSGYIYFDKNSNGTRDNGEGTYVYGNYAGSASSTITIPDVSTGSYSIKYQSSNKSEVTATTSFTVVDSPKVTLSYTKGKIGSRVYATVSNLPYTYDYGYIYFDSNNNGSYDYGENYTYVYGSYSYTASGTLTVPDVTAGSYNVRFKSSYYSYAVEAASFTVEQPSITLSSTTGKVGGSTTVSLNNLPAYDYGYIYFDKNNNGSRDSEEGIYISANYDGTATRTITIPDVSAGAFNIKYESSYKAEIRLKAVFTVEGASVESITLNKSTLTLNEGDSAVRLTSSISPNDAANKNVNWSSSDDSIAKVDEDGNVTPLKAGTAKITATTEDGNKEASCTVTVNSKSVEVSKLNLNKTNITMTLGEETVTLKATISPENATNKNVSWKSSNESIATVDGNGKVIPKAVGTANIIVTSEDGNKTASCSITVIKAEKTDYTFSELIDDEETFNSILGKFTLDELKVKVPENYIKSIKITQNDQIRLSSFEVTADSDSVDAVKIKANGKEYVMNYKGDGVYKMGIYNLPKGCELIINAYNDGKLVDSNVQRLRTLTFNSSLPEKTEYTLEELIDDLDLFNEILGNYTLDQIHVITPVSYIESTQIKYNSIATAIIAIVKNGANKVEFETKVNGQTKTFKMINKGGGKFEGSAAGLQPGTEVKIKVYKDDKLVDQIAKKITK